ncbi:hypothetical protein FSP39_000593 [Pinctada imbricata]|uniref:Mab-21-like HhH/H2TH-like domain-containing protein n=1 Tax=Pinctada imbricata TaxID=66713 RepID=A0AA88Y6L5_PINIB|nr:hypothetical protein FSP39_000593 [Pinctada imbricata]
MYVVAKESKTKMERNIQRMQLLEYALRNILDLPLAFAGSRAEGSNDAVSDTDMTYTVSSYKVYNVDEAFPNEDDMNILRLEQSSCHPGYCKLYVVKTRQTRGWDGVFHNTCSEGTYLSTDTYLKDAQTRVSAVFNNLGATLKNKNRINAPAVTPKIQFGAGEKEPNVDVAFLIPCANWPNVANEWLYRKRLYGWPDKLLMETIKKHACGFVPIGYLETRDRNFEWRISFNAAERSLVWSFTGTQLLCLEFLKILLSYGLDLHFPKLLCSFFMKTLLFWHIEETPSDFWRPENLVECLTDSIVRLMKCLKTANCPHYFLRDNNMFDKKDKTELREALTYVDSLHKNHLIVCYIKMKTYFYEKNVIFKYHIPLIGLSFSRHLTHCICWDSLRTKINVLEPFRNAGMGIDHETIGQINNSLASTIGSLSYSFTIDPTTPGEDKENAKRLILQGTKSDLMAGPLKHATILLWEGKVSEALEVVDRLSRTDLNKVILYSLYYRSFINDPNDKSHPIDDKMSLQEVMTKFIALDVIFLPAEIKIAPDFVKFQLSNRSPLFISPILYTYCLGFSCHRKRSDVRSMVDTYDMFCKARFLFRRGGVPFLDTDLKGYFQMAIGNREKAFGFFASSIKSRKTKNMTPSIWLLSTLLFHPFKSNTDTEDRNNSERKE